MFISDATEINMISDPSRFGDIQYMYKQQVMGKIVILISDYGQVFSV